MSPDNLTDADIETIEQYTQRIAVLEAVLRYVLQHGMTKESYRRIGQALENKS